jgi:hypothetical protein
MMVKKEEQLREGDDEGGTTLPTFWSWRAGGWFKREGVVRSVG